MEQRADHIMLAYRIKQGEDIKQGSVSNGEHFGDLEVMKVLVFQERVNVVLFVAYQYGGIHLGRCRFQLIEDVAEEALSQVQTQFHYELKPQWTENRRGRGRGRGGRGRGDGYAQGPHRGRGFNRGWRGRGQSY